MRAVIYARYSTDLQSAASIDDQVRLCRERVERDGHELVHVTVIAPSQALRCYGQASSRSCRMQAGESLMPFMRKLSIVSAATRRTLRASSRECALPL